ncbi:MAG: SRPBCC domain-containing protein [Halobacteriota archaeon]
MALQNDRRTDPKQQIVQKWRGADWPQDHYSAATFEVKARGQQTRLDVAQADISEFSAELKAG